MICLLYKLSLFDSFCGFLLHEALRLRNGCDCDFIKDDTVNKHFDHTVLLT